MLTPAARTIQNPGSFARGTCYRNFLEEPCGPHQSPVAFDCLGALLWAYRATDVENRHIVAKRVFELCQARHGHRMLGKLEWEQAFELLRDAQA